MDPKLPVLYKEEKYDIICETKEEYGMESKKSRLRELREQNEMTADEISKRLGISKQFYWLYERNPIKIRADRLIALADMFGVSVDYILGRGAKMKKITAYELDCIKKIREMKKEDRKMVYKMIRMICESEAREKSDKE